jgi:hypothetical protein
MGERFTEESLWGKMAKRKRDESRSPSSKESANKIYY